MSNTSLKQESFVSLKFIENLFKHKAKPLEDNKGRESSIFKLPKLDYEEAYLKRKFEQIFNKSLLVSGLSLLRLNEPTKPHVDGLPPTSIIYDSYGKKKKYKFLKVGIILLAFDTDYDVENLSTDIILFKNHLEFIPGGLELEHHVKSGMSNLDIPWRDYNGKLLDQSPQNFTDDEENFPHVFVTHKKLAEGITIDKKYNMKIGDMVCFNPYQLHCTKRFQNFESKILCRFQILEPV